MRWSSDAISDPPLQGAPKSNGGALLTKRGFHAVILTMLSFHLAAGIPRMAARRWVREESGTKQILGSAILQATS